MIWKDRQEMHSKYDNPEYSEKVAELKQGLARLREWYQLPPLEPISEETAS